jgi:hypothetical protein
MKKSFQDMAHRIVTAESSFVETLMRCGDLTKDEAIKVKATYRKLRIIKNEYAVSRITVKHGAFLDREVIRRALNY